MADLQIPLDLPSTSCLSNYNRRMKFRSYKRKLFSLKNIGGTDKSHFMLMYQQVARLEWKDIMDLHKKSSLIEKLPRENYLCF